MESIDFEEKTSSSLVYKVVPWVNWDEWNCVRKSIFSSSPKLICGALEKVSTWESRGCLPIAIELTAIIVEIHQNDPFFRIGDDSTGAALPSEKMLNMLYCMFILRLVNDFVEPAHKKTGRSISDLAEAVGIPRTLVDIRHESTHRCLPSLKLVRSASVKALEWLKANYWEPQRIAIHDPRKEVKSRIHELILSLRAHQVPSVDSAKNKRKYSKRTSILMKCHKLSHISERMLASKSDGFKVHILKLTRRVAQLYSLYPSEVVSVLLECFLSQASDISDDIDMEQSDDSDCSIPEPISISSNDLKMVITKVLRKKPRLLLTMLKAIFEMIEEKDTRNFENAIEISQVHRLRSLVPYLIRNLKALKDSGQILLFEEDQSLSTDNIATPKVILVGLLRKCVALIVPGDEHLRKSALLLAEMSGNRFLVQKLKKLPLLSSPNHNQFAPDIIGYNESMLLEEESSVKQAADTLDRINLRLVDRKSRKRSRSSTESEEKTCRWTVTKSWVSCPMGMVPCSFSSTAVIPVLDEIEEEGGGGLGNESQTVGQNADNTCELESPGDEEVLKKLNQTPEDEDDAGSPFMEGRLLIGGIWKKVSEEELASLESDIRIFV